MCSGQVLNVACRDAMQHCQAGHNSLEHTPLATLHTPTLHCLLTTTSQSVASYSFSLGTSKLQPASGQNDSRPKIMLIAPACLQSCHV